MQTFQTKMVIINTSIIQDSSDIREAIMPLRVMCSECAHVLYEGDILKSPQDIAKRYDGRCPACRKKLKTDIKSFSIYPYVEKDDK